METTEQVKRRIKSTEDLQSVVKTMKAMAAVKIRRFELAVEALRDYSRTVNMGLRIILRSNSGNLISTRPENMDTPGAIVFGSDQGMCGQLNDQIVAHAVEDIKKVISKPEEKYHVIAVGRRVTGRLEEARQPVQDTLSVPSSVEGIPSSVLKLLNAIEKWNSVGKVNRVFLYYCRPLSGARFEPHTIRLLPMDNSWLNEIRKEPWPTKMLPLYTMDWDSLFSSLIRQYLTISLFRAFADSLASENASRLASMQGAEKNIQEQLDDLSGRYQKQRQMSITEELLDIVSGFEALKEE